MDSSEASRAIEVDGRRLAWRSIGREQALLLVNGYAAAAFMAPEPARVANLISSFVRG